MIIIFVGSDVEMPISETYKVGDLVPVRGGDAEVVKVEGDKAYIRPVKERWPGEYAARRYRGSNS